MFPANRLRRLSIPGLMASALVACLFVRAYGAEQPRIGAKVTAIPEATLTAEERKAVSHAAAGILRHVIAARNAIARGDKEIAVAHVEKGLRLCRIIEKALPTFTVRSSISAGDTKYDDVHNVKPLIVPIYDGFEGLSFLDNVVETRNRTARQSTPSAAPVVPDVAFYYSGASLNVAMARGDLEKARGALIAGDLDGARRAIAEVADAVIFRVDVVRLPLVSARENLLVARSEVRAGRFTQARASLDAAAANLDRYAGAIGASAGREPRQMSAQIRSLAADLSKTTGGTEKSITGWWERLSKW